MIINRIPIGPGARGLNHIISNEPGLPLRTGWLYTLLCLLTLTTWVRAENFIGFDYRHSEYQPSGRQDYYSWLRFGQSQRLGTGWWQSYWEMNSASAYGFGLSRFQVNLTDVSAPGGRWSLFLGDQDLQTGSSLAGNLNFRGVKLVGQWNRDQRTEASGGQAPDLYNLGLRPSFQSNRVMTALTHRARLRKGTLLRAFLFQRQDTTSWRPGGRFNKSTQLGGLLLEEETSYGLKTSNQLVYSYAHKDDSSKQSGASGGTEWQWRARAGGAGLSFHFVSPRFCGIKNDGAMAGYQSLSLSGHYLFLQALGLNAAYSRHWPQRSDDSSAYIANYWRGSCGARFQYRRWPGIAYHQERYRGFTYLGPKLLSGSEQRIHSLNMEYNFRGGEWRWSYRLLKRKELSSGSIARQHRYYLSAAWQWEFMGLHLNQELERSDSPRQTSWFQTAGLELKWGGRFQTLLDIGLDQRQDEGRDWHVRSWSWEAKQSFALGQGWRSAGSFRRTVYPSFVNSSQMEWSWSLEKSFDSWNQFIGLGTISGFVFEDDNANGRHDPEEPGLPGVPIYLDGERKTVTDREGSYKISGLSFGRHRLSLDLKYLRASLEPGNGMEKDFWCYGLPGARADFPLLPLTAIRGRVFFDDNRNGIRDQEETGLGGIYVLMEDRSRFVASDEEGDFVFHNLKPGRVKIYLDSRFLPDTLEVVGSQQYLVEIEDRKGAAPVEFALARRIRPIRKIVFEPSSLLEEPAQAQPIPGWRPSGRRSGLSPSEFKRLYDQGVRYFSAGEYGRALEIWQRILKADPENQTVRRNMQRTRDKLEAMRKAGKK